MAYIPAPQINNISSIRVYYNQASGDGQGNLSLVNWFDGNYLGLLRKPLLPIQKEVYRDLQGRMLLIPVIHVTELMSYIIIQTSLNFYPILEPSVDLCKLQERNVG